MAFAFASRARLQATLAWIGSLLLWWRVGGIGFAAFAATMTLLAVLAWFAPATYAPIQRALDRVLHVFLTGLTWLLLAVVFYGVFVPLRVMRTLFRRQTLPLQPDLKLDTYLQPLPPAARDRFERQF